MRILKSSLLRRTNTDVDLERTVQESAKISPKVMDKPIMIIINNQLDIKL